MTPWSGAGVGLLLLTLATLCASAASAKRVLILDAFGHDVAPSGVSMSAFRTTLAREFGAPLEFYEISLDRARFPEPEGPDPFVEFLQSRLTNRPMDLVATFGGPAMDFVMRHHERFFPNTPIVFMAGPPGVAQAASLRAKAIQVTHKLNFAGMVEDILQLQPQTTNIVVVLGASPLETVTMNNCRREFQRFTNRVAFTWLNDLPLDQVLERCATLPPRSFVLHLSFLVDVARASFDQEEPLRRLHAVANAPVFGYFASELGLGPIGGRLYQDSEVGAQAARTAIRILHGENPGTIPVLELQATTPVYDWRELRHWGISESLLPPGSIVRYRQLTFWERYRWRIVGVLGFCGLQTALIIGLIVNRAKRREGEAALRESEERMTLASAAAGFGVWMWNVERNQVWASDRWRRLFGFAPDAAVTFEQVIGRIHPDDRENVEREMRRAVADRMEFMAEYRIVLPDGTQRWVLARARVDAESNRKPMRMLGATIEITQRKEAELDLRESNERFRLVVEASPSGMILVDESGRIALVNAQIQKLFGYAPEELIGQAVDLLVPDRFRAGHQSHRASFHQAPAPRMMGQGRELFGRRKDGTEFPLEIGLSSVQGTEGILVLAAVVDLSARKQAEAEVSRQRAELTHVARVAMLGELSGSMAHELNQPLTAILSNAQAAQRFLSDDHTDLNEVRDILADIVAEDKRAGEVIHRLRLLFKKGEVCRQPLSVNNVILDVLKLLRSELANQNFTAETQLAPDLPIVHADVVQLQQVLLNLALNACEAMAGAQSRDRELTLRTERCQDGSVHVSVADCGPGIASEKLERIFESFYTTKPQGMGLGLAVCRTIITAQGGILWATNNPARGATVHFTLPVNGKEQGGKEPVASGY